MAVVIGTFSCWSVGFCDLGFDPLGRIDHAAKLGLRHEAFSYAVHAFVQKDEVSLCPLRGVVADSAASLRFFALIVHRQRGLPGTSLRDQTSRPRDYFRIARKPSNN
jgi:hypothetical protein